MHANPLKVVHRWVGNSKPWVESLLGEAQSKPSIAVIVVMGSAIRECGHRRSDLDLLVLYHGVRPKLYEPIEVDIRFIDVNRADEQIEAGHEVICWALKFGIALFDRHGIWKSLKRKWINRIPLPSIAQAEERAFKSFDRAKELLDSDDVAAANDLLLAAVTQFVRARLIQHKIFPASRPELPGQLREVSLSDPLAQILEDSMYSDISPRTLLQRLTMAVPSLAHIDSDA